jgi:uncharacterized protein YndB with AHSA1/START domain
MHLTNTKGKNTMITPSVTHTRFTIERTYPTTPERVFAAFADPAKKRRWFAAASDTHEVQEFEMDFRVGGQLRSSYRMNQGTPFPGAILTNHTNYLDVVPNRRIVIAYTMAFGEEPFSASLSTFELLPTENGTTLVFTEQAAFFEGADGPQMREDGWRKLLDQLAAELARETATLNAQP